MLEAYFSIVKEITKHVQVTYPFPQGTVVYSAFPCYREFAELLSPQIFRRETWRVPTTGNWREIFRILEIIPEHAKGYTAATYHLLGEMFNRNLISSENEKIMLESHVPPYVGHRGIQPTTQTLETYFYWLLMCKDIQKYVEQCVTCQKVKYDRGKAIGLL